MWVWLDLASWFTRRVDHFHPIHHFSYIRVLMKSLDNIFSNRGQQHIIRVQENYDLSAALVKASVHRGCLPTILLEDGKNAFSIRINYLVGTIGRAIIDDYNFYGWIALSQRTVNCICEKIAIVVICY